MNYTPDKIRNIAIVGHQGSGKTSLVESLAFKSGLIKEKGSIEKKNTLSDYLSDEKKKLSSISTSIIPITHFFVLISFLLIFIQINQIT